MDLCIGEKIFICKKIKTFSFLSSCLQCLLKIESCLHWLKTCLRLPQSHPDLSFAQRYIIRGERKSHDHTYFCQWLRSQYLWQLELWLHCQAAHDCVTLAKIYVDFVAFTVLSAAYTQQWHKTDGKRTGIGNETAVLPGKSAPSGWVNCSRLLHVLQHLSHM